MKYFLMILIFIAVAVIGTLIYDLQMLIDYTNCVHQPASDLSAHCVEVINAVSN